MDDDAGSVSPAMEAALERIRERSDRGERTWVVRSNPGGTGIRLRTAQALVDRGWVVFVDLGAAVVAELTLGGQHLVGYLAARRAARKAAGGE